MKLEGKKWSDLCGPIGVLALVMIFFTPAIAGTFFFRDTFNMFYPFKAVLADYWRQGVVCLWDSWETMGSPFVGELGPGWFYPGNAWYLLFSAPVAFRLFLVSHYVLAAATMGLWLRWTGAGRAGAAAGALSYTLSGYALTQSGIMDMLVLCAWLPTSLWLLSLHLRRRSPSALLLFGVSLTMPFLAGRAEGVMINGLAAAGWLMTTESAGAGLPRRLITALKLMTVAGVAALLTSMIQFLPSWELGRLSMKGAGYALTETTLWSFHPDRLLEFILPSPWGRFWPTDYYCGWDLTGWEGYYPWTLTEYMGIPIVIGFIVAAFRASWHQRLVTGGLLVIALLISFGTHTPVYAGAAAIFPPLRVFRFPEKYMILAVLIVAAAGARGLDHILDWSRRADAAKADKYIAAAAGALVPVIWLVTKLFPFSSLGECVNAAGQVKHRLPENYLALQFHHLFFILLGLALIIALGRRRTTRALAGPLLTVLVFLDLSLANSWIIPYTDPKIYQGEPPILALIRDHAKDYQPDLFGPDGKARLGRGRMMREPRLPDEKVLFGIEGKTRIERYRRWERDTLLENFNYLYRVEGLTGYSAAATADFNKLMRCCLNQKTMALFNVRYAICPSQGSWLESEGAPVAAEDYLHAIKVFYLPQAFPRAYLIGKSRRVERSMDELDLIAAHDFHAAVILDDDPRLPAEAEESALAPVPAEIISYEPDQARFRTRAEAPSYLVLSDLYYPGWEAEVDKVAVPIFRANFLVRAVRVPAGEHEVVFSYRPGSYRWGRTVTLISLFLMLGVFAGEFGVGPALRQRQNPK